MFVNSIRDFRYTVHSADYDFFALEAAFRNFCSKYFLSDAAVDNALKLADILLKHIPFTHGEANLIYRFAEKTGHLSLEMELPAAVGSIFTEMEEADYTAMRACCTSMTEQLVEREGKACRLLRFSV